MCCTPCLIHESVIEAATMNTNPVLPMAQGSEVPASAAPPAATLGRQLLKALKSPPVMVAFIVFSIVIVLSVLAPVLGTVDPVAINPGKRFAGITEDHWLG